MPTESVVKIHLPGKAPLDGRIISDDRPQLTNAEAAAGLEWVDGDYAVGNIIRYGANPSGVVDAVDAISKAILVCEQDKTPVYIPAGTYLISAPLVINSNCTIRGDGKFKSRIRCNTTTGDIFQATSAALIDISGLELYYVSSQTGGVAFNFDTVTQFHLSDMRILSPFNAMDIIRCGTGIFEGIDVLSNVNRGFYIRDSVSMVFYSIVCPYAAAIPTDASFIIESDCDTIYFFYIQSVGSAGGGNAPGIDIRNGGTDGGTYAGVDPRWIKFYGAAIEGGQGGDVANAEHGIEISAGTSLEFFGCYAAVCRNGYLITGGNGIQIHGGEILANGQHGISMSGGTAIHIDGVDIHNNGINTSNTYDGINVGAVDGFKITNCDIGQLTGFGATRQHRYDIGLTNNASDNYVITGNHLRDGQTAPLLDAGTGTNKIIKDNIIGTTSNDFELVTATNVITNVENGKVFYLDAVGGFTSTLPAPQTNLKFTFIVRTAPTTAYIITTNAGANLLYGTFLDIVGELTYFSAQDTLNFVASTAVVGDRLEVESDGTNWYCKAFSGADGGITVSVT